MGGGLTDFILCLLPKVKQSVNPKYDARGALAAAADFATNNLLPIKVTQMLVVDDKQC